jgi:hypothetical protein
MTWRLKTIDQYCREKSSVDVVHRSVLNFSFFVRAQHVIRLEQTVKIFIQIKTYTSENCRIIFVNNQLDAQFLFSCIFISILSMFRAAMCPSSGELIVSIRHLVYVTVYRWLFGVQVQSCRFPAHQTAFYTEWHITDVVLIQLILLLMDTWLPETCWE